jgi:hypothetical protein
MNIINKTIREIAWEEFNNTPPNPTNIEYINNNQCKFHLDDEKSASDSNTLFCGKPRFKNYSYCAWHYIKAHDIKK